jgi:hypothetical protein
MGVRKVGGAFVAMESAVRRFGKYPPCSVRTLKPNKFVLELISLFYICKRSGDSPKR